MRPTDNNIYGWQRIANSAVEIESPMLWSRIPVRWLLIVYDHDLLNAQDWCFVIEKYN